MEGQVGMMNNLNPGPVRIVKNPDGSLTQAAMMQVRPVCVSVCAAVCAISKNYKITLHLFI